MNFTPLIRLIFAKYVKSSLEWIANGEQVQRAQLAMMIKAAKSTFWGEKYDFASINTYEDFAARVPMSPYEDIRPLVTRMINGERDILWPGRIKNYAQSSGTSDGKSKYIPITPDSFRLCHYRGAYYPVAFYLNQFPDSHAFSGKGFILGGSFANELSLPKDVVVGDLSANLIHRIPTLINMFRVPSKEVALLEDWSVKLPALVDASISQNITNISGVPSWFLTVLKEVIKKAGASTIHDVWPDLEVFFHGGISFDPYREQYNAITDTSKMRYFETYNASEGFFAAQNDINDRAMMLILDAGVFYEFIPLNEIDSPTPTLLPLWKVEPGKVYAMVITSCNGLWRYPLGDTVKIESVNPVKITIAGRTKHYINAFGEELMVHNANAAITKACQQLGCSILNYTAAPVYAGDRSRGRHEWLIEWSHQPENIEEFANLLDELLQQENSDYQAKRFKDIFLDRLSVVTAQSGLFNRWLASTGKLGGQRKVPRLCNDRRFIDPMLELNNN